MFPLDQHCAAHGIAPEKVEGRHFAQLAASLCDIGKNFYARGWALGTGGNYSAVVSHNPLLVAITASGLDKGTLIPSEILQVNDLCEVVFGNKRPSYEVLVHLAIARLRGVGAVLHTHSVWATILSEKFAPQSGLTIGGYEMIKGLEGVRSHQHREWVPILPNSQDIPQLAATVERLLREHPAVHGFLLQGHGLYTWGETIGKAQRHVEIFEFLFEVAGHGQGAEAETIGVRGGQKDGGNHNSG